MEEIQSVMNEVLDSDEFISNYRNIFAGDDQWNILNTSPSDIFLWNNDSTYIREAPFFKNLPEKPPMLTDIKSARVLLKLGDSVTTDHISPAGSIAEDSPAGEYLRSKGIEKKDFNSYGSRRGNHEVMVRGTFANVRLRNELVNQEGGYTIHFPSQEVMSVFNASEKYLSAGTSLIILAGKEYGSGSSRDWAAKGVSLLGVKAIVAESFERIHRSNLVGMGVLPLQFMTGENASTLGLDGTESFDIEGIDHLAPDKEIKITATTSGRKKIVFNARARLDSVMEVEYYRNEGILQYVLRSFLERNKYQPSDSL
jgi:aconitate hydratase